MYSFQWILKKSGTLLILCTLILGGLPLDGWAGNKKNQKAIQVFERDLAREMKAFGKDSPQVAVAWNNLGVAWRANDPDKALGYLEKALASNLKNFGADHPRVAHNLSNLGHVWQAKGNYDKAMEHFTQALAIHKKSGKKNFIQYAEDRVEDLKKEMDGKK